MGKAIIIGGDFSAKNVGTVQFVASGVPIAGITIASKPATITNTAQLSNSVSPVNTTQALVVWQSSDINIATVTQSGLVTVLQSGQVTITCRSFYNAAVLDSFVVDCVKELIAVTSISLTAPKTALSTGEQLTISVSKLPANAETGLTMSYQITGDISIVSQSNTQIVIQAGDSGTWSVTGTTSNGISGSINGTVLNVTVTAIELTANETDLNVGDQLLISVVKTPSDATVGTAMTYTLTGPIESINEQDNGITITTTGEGNWSVTATSSNGMSDTISGTSAHIAVTAITLSAPKTGIVIDEQLTIIVSKTPSNATTGTAMTYTPSGPISIVSQNDNQVVIRGTGEGAWSITGTTSNSVIGTISGSVSPVAITGVTLVASKAAPWDNGDVVTVTAQIIPANATLTNFVLSHSGAGTVTGQTATSITITADEEGTATVVAMNGASQLASQNYSIVFTVSDPSLVYQLDADNFTSGSVWTPTVGNVNAEVLAGVKENGMVRFLDTTHGTQVDSSLRADISTLISNTGDWTVYFEGVVPPITISTLTLNMVIGVENGAAFNYKQMIYIYQDNVTSPAQLMVGSIDWSTPAAIEANQPFVNKAIIVKRNNKFDIYSLKADNTIMSKLEWITGNSTVITAFLANPGFCIVNRRRDSWSIPISDNSIKQIQVFNRAFNLSDVQAKFGV